MLRRTLARSAQEARKPMIRFPDRKGAPKQHEPHPHPAAPKEVAQDFSHFQEVFQSGPHFDPAKVEAASSSSSPSSSSGKGGEVFEDLHDLPKRFWQTASMVIEESEMDAINSGGATLVQK